MADSSVAKDAHTGASRKLETAELLFRQATLMGLRPSWIIPDAIFAVWADGREQYVNLGRSPLNSGTGISLAKDKYATRLILERHALPNIPFARPQTQADAAQFLSTYGKIIAKPFNGSGAQDIHIVTDVAQLQALQIDGYILEQYIAGQEWRFLILGERVIGVHRSEYGTSVDHSRPLQRLSYPENEWNPILLASSLKIARILGLTFAAVDYLIDAAGRSYVLEVNTMPGMKWFHAPTSGPVVDVARYFLEAIFGRSPETPAASAVPVLGAHSVVAYS